MMNDGTQSLFTIGMHRNQYCLWSAPLSKLKFTYHLTALWWQINLSDVAHSPELKLKFEIKIDATFACHKFYLRRQ